MISLFDGIYPNKRLVSSNQLQMTLKLFQQDLMNGLVEVSYSSEEKVLLLFSSGKIACAYHCRGETNTRYPLLDLSVLLNDHNEGQLRVCELAPSFLRAVKTIIEQPAGSTTSSSNKATLLGMIQQSQTMPEPSLLRVSWPHAEGFVFLPGNNFSPRQYAFVSEGQSSDSANAVSMFAYWSEFECAISQHMGNTQIEIWRENSLQLGFVLLIEDIMRRYEELVGQALSRRLEDSINRLSRTHSWNISIAGTFVDDVQLFDSINDAALAYQMILELASRQISSVIGVRLFNEAVETGLSSLGGQLRDTLEDNHLVTTLSANLVRG